MKFKKILVRKFYKEVECVLHMRKNPGKIVGLTLFSLILLSIIPSLVVAADAGQVTSNIVTGVSGSISSALTPLFGDQELLMRTLFALLLAMLVYSAVSVMFQESKVISWIISGLVTAIALYGLPSGFLEALRSSYGAMGAALLTIVPFIIVLLFSFRVGNGFIARITWLFFAIYYFVLYIYNWAGLGGAWDSSAALPYLLGVIAGIIIFFFIIPIRKAVFKGKLEAVEEEGKKIARRGGLLHELQKDELEESYSGKKK